MCSVSLVDFRLEMAEDVYVNCDRRVGLEVADEVYENVDVIKGRDADKGGKGNPKTNQQAQQKGSTLHFLYYLSGMVHLRNQQYLVLN